MSLEAIDYSDWTECKIETFTKEKMLEEHGKSGENKYNDYLRARNEAFAIAAKIAAKEPNLTDHGPDHIRNVMMKAYQLLGEDIEKLNGAELYCLLLSIIMHDLGNIHGRDNHQINIRKAYDDIFNDGSSTSDQKAIVTQVVAAHCGKTADGKEKDTFKDLGPMNIFKNPVKVDVCKIAAILRFADELSEGPQRTSDFMVKHYDYPEESLIHHKYANSVRVMVDRNSDKSRIALTYYINNITHENQDDFCSLMKYIYERIIKLNNERIYAKYYCDLFSTFKEVTASFNFDINEVYFTDAQLGLNGIVLTDPILHTGEVHDIEVSHPAYKLDSLFESIIEKCQN